MSKITLNPMFQNHSGRMGNIVHYTLFGRQYCRRHVIPKNPRTECQQAVRRTFSDAVHAWGRLTRDEKSEYNRRALRKKTRGYNLYISMYMKGQVKTGNMTDVHGVQQALCRPSSFTMKVPRDDAASMQLRSSSDDATCLVKDGVYSGYTQPARRT